MARDFIERLKFLFQADGKEFKKELNRAKKDAKSFTAVLITTFDKAGAKTTAFVEGVGGMFAGVIVSTAQKLYGATKEAIAYADSLMTMSKVTGESVEYLSTMSYAADLMKTSIVDLQAGMEEFAIGLATASEPGNEIVAALKNIGVNARDANKNMRPMKDIIDDVADAFHDAEDGAGKLAAAQAIFGTTAGASWIPLLNEGAAGLRLMREEARAFGLEVSTKTAQEAAEFQQQLVKLETTSRSVGLAMAKELLPSLTRIGDAFVTQTKKGGFLEGAFNAIGAAAVEAAGGIEKTTAAANLERMEKRLERINHQLETQKKNVAEGRSEWMRSLLGLEPREDRILELEGKRLETVARIASLRKAVTQQAKSREQIEKKLSTIITERKKIEIPDPSIAKAAADARARALKDAETKAARERAAIVALARQLTMTGELTAVEKMRFEIAKGSAKNYSAATQERLLVMAAELDAKNAFLEADKEAIRIKDNLAAALTREVEHIREVTRTEEEQKAAEIARIEELAGMNAISTEMQIRALAEIEERYGSMKDKAESSFITIKQFGEAAATGLRSNFKTLLFDPTEDGFKSMVSAWADSLNKMAAEALTQQIFGNLFGAGGGGGGGGLGGLFGFSGGGGVHGPGSSTSDSILARLSDGEFVVRAAAVRAYGAPFLRAVNSMKFPSAAGMPASRRRSLHFAEGGLVTGGATGAETKIDLTIANLVDRDMFDQMMAGKKGERAVINHILNNASEVKRVLAG